MERGARAVGGPLGWVVGSVGDPAGGGVGEVRARPWVAWAGAAGAEDGAPTRDSVRGFYRSRWAASMSCDPIPAGSAAVCTRLFVAP